jgi:hypothetical protein
MIYTITGSREFAHPEVIATRLRQLLVRGEDQLITGGARGVDTVAEKAGRAAGIDVLPTIRAEWNGPDGKGVFDPEAGFTRNTPLVACGQRTIGFWDGSSRGTADCMIKALNAGKLYRVYFNDGHFYWTPDITFVEIRTIGSETLGPAWPPYLGHVREVANGIARVNKGHGYPDDFMAVLVSAWIASARARDIRHGFEQINHVGRAALATQAHLFER